MDNGSEGSAERAETRRNSILGAIDRTSTFGNVATGAVLAMGAEVHRVTTCLLEPIDSQYRLIAWYEAENSPERSLVNQFADQLEDLGSNLHRRLWDAENDRPFTESVDIIGQPPVDYIAIAASPCTRVRVWLVGISERHSMAAAHSAIESTQATVVGVSTLASQTDPEQVAEDIELHKAEGVVLVGGYEVSGTVQSSLIELAEFIVATYQHLSEKARPALLYAGNSYAFETVASLLMAQGIRITRRIDNVSPQPGVTLARPLTLAIDEVYLEKCRRCDKFQQIEGWGSYEGDLLTVETSFTRLIQLWVDINQLPELYGIYTGKNRWLHVWADAEANRVLVSYTAPDGPSTINSWRPDVRLVSGPWREDEDLPDSVVWQDSRGFGPIVASAALASPKAAIDVLRNDIFPTST